MPRRRSGSQPCRRDLRLRATGTARKRARRAQAAPSSHKAAFGPALTLDAVNKEFVLNVDKSVLENATGFDKDNWPDMADPRFGSDIYRHYGYKPYWEDVA